MKYMFFWDAASASASAAWKHICKWQQRLLEATQSSKRSSTHGLWTSCLSSGRLQFWTWCLLMLISQNKKRWRACHLELLHEPFRFFIFRLLKDVKVLQIEVESKSWQALAMWTIHLSHTANWADGCERPWKGLDMFRSGSLSLPREQICKFTKNLPLWQVCLKFPFRFHETSNKGKAETVYVITLSVSNAKATARQLKVEIKHCQKSTSTVMRNCMKLQIPPPSRITSQHPDCSGFQWQYCSLVSEKCTWTPQEAKILEPQMSLKSPAWPLVEDLKGAIT